MHNVLIIDDEPWSREVVKALGDWESLCLRIIGEAEDGNDGLRRIGELRPHIAITDMRMPGLEGAELLKEMNERFPSLKIIVMSGYDDFVYLKQAIRSRAVDYLLKPIDPAELNASLERCVRELGEADAAHQVSSRKAPAVFADASALDKYLAYRRRIYEHLLKLNGSAVHQTLAKMEAFLEVALPLVQEQDERVLAEIVNDYLVMLEEFASEHGIGRRSARTELKSIPEAIGEIGRLYAEVIHIVENRRKNRNRLDLAEVQAHIGRHYQDPITLETIAQHFYVSKEHLSRAFKAFTGENVSDAIVRRRMEKAKELIVERKLALKQVAELTGYADLAYFYRVFRKHFGMTPGELRKEEGGGINKMQ